MQYGQLRPPLSCRELKATKLIIQVWCFVGSGIGGITTFEEQFRYIWRRDREGSARSLFYDDLNMAPDE